jgi:hypothetical protein
MDMHRRKFLQTGIATSALLSLPAAATSLLHPAQSGRFALGYHSGSPGDAWIPALSRMPGATPPRLRIALRGMQLAQRDATLQRMHVDLLYRAPELPAYFYATLRRDGQLATSQPVTLELDADRLAGLRVDYVWRDASGQDRRGVETLPWTDAINPLLTPGVYALVGARATGAPPAWHQLASPGPNCALDRCDQGPVDFDALIIGVVAA